METMEQLEWPLYDLRAPIAQAWNENQRIYRKFGLEGHNGLDIGVVEGTAVLASAPGKVVFAGDGVGSPIMGASAGLCVLIDHGDVLTEYAHLSKIYVKTGDDVRREVVALSGATGAVSGPHLHWGAISTPYTPSNGYMGRTDPSPYLTREDTRNGVDNSPE